MTKQETAILLFVYNRPDHTLKVLEGLKKNNVKRLYVFCDGPKTQEDLVKVERTRELIRNIDWCEVESVFRERNIGLATSIINGVTDIFQKGYDSVIVLEDDCVPKENFIKFMVESLEYYRSSKEVMHISGFGLPIKKYTDADVYFTPYPCSWGWGTWADVWMGCDFSQTKGYLSLLKNNEVKKRFNYSGEAFSEFLKFQLEGKVNSWLIRWYYYIFMKNGRCVWSYESLIENKGFDGSGVHKVKFDRFNQKNIGNLQKVNFKFENNLAYNEKLIREFRRYFNGNGIWEKIKTIIYLSTGIILEKPKKLGD